MLPLAPVRIEAPVDLPVSLDEIKDHLRVDHSDQDVLLNDLIQSKVADLDGPTGSLGRALITQTWQQSFARFCDPLRLPFAPVLSITSVAYYDGSNVQQSLSTDVYQLLTDYLGPKLVRKSDQLWPGSYTREDAISVTFVAGYGDAASVPENVKSIIKLAVQLEFDALEPDEVEKIQNTIDRIKMKLRRIWL